MSGMKVDRPTLERQLCGAIRSSISAHGPITMDTAPSAAKRMIGVLKALGIFREDVGENEEVEVLSRDSTGKITGAIYYDHP